MFQVRRNFIKACNNDYLSRRGEQAIVSNLKSRYRLLSI